MREELISDALALRLTKTATADLAEIWAHLASEASETVATKFVDAIKADFDRLLVFPFSGAPRSQFAPGLRVAFHGAWVIYYAPVGSELVVVRVVHGARDAEALGDRGGFGLDTP